MDAVKFYEAMQRMCNENSCRSCPLDCECSEFENVDAEFVVKTVEQWSKDHPVKTRQSEFLKMFPNANIKTITASLSPCVLDREENPQRCAKYGYLSISCRCIKCRDDYWNEEVTDND